MGVMYDYGNGFTIDGRWIFYCLKRRMNGEMLLSGCYPAEEFQSTQLWQMENN